MVSKLALLASLVMLGSTAHADPPATTPAASVPILPADRGYAGIGLAALLSRSFAIGATGEGAVRIASTPLLIRGMAASGTMSEWFEPRTYHITEARLGIEADTCSPARGLCVLIGVDLGYLWEGFTSAESHAALPPSTRRFTVLPRVGLEFGSSVVRLRTAFEYGQNAAALQLALMFHFR